MLRQCCHILASCWTMLWAMLDRRGPPEVILGYVVFMTSPSFPKFCLKKLSPVACEAPPSFLQHHFSEKAESCWDGHTPDERLKAPTSGLRGSRKGFSRVGRGVGGFPLAEATIQATTSLPLHGMAGFKGCRPVPPTPFFHLQEDAGRWEHAQAGSPPGYVFSKKRCPGRESAWASMGRRWPGRKSAWSSKFLEEEMSRPGVRLGIYGQEMARQGVRLVIEVFGRRDVQGVRLGIVF